MIRRLLDRQMLHPYIFGFESRIHSTVQYIHASDGHPKHGLDPGVGYSYDLKSDIEIISISPRETYQPTSTIAASKDGNKSSSACW